MNGPMKMYRSKQIVRHDFRVELPKCMYIMKNIHSGRNGVVDGSSGHVAAPKEKLDIFDQVKQFLKVLFIFNIIRVLANILKLILMYKNCVLTNKS